MAYIAFHCSLIHKAGLAEVYVGAGAVYGHKRKEAYLQMQSKAERRKVGMWSLYNRESAAEFKSRMK
jgi:endonuclease YncB( thermonuclease family)